MLVKQTVTLTFSLLIVLFIVNSPVHAAGLGMYSVETDLQVEMKTAPTDNAETVGILVRGDKLTIFEKKNGWVQTFYNGKEVWVASQYIVKVDDQEESPPPEEEPAKEPENIKSKNTPDELKKAEAPELKSATIEISSVGPLSNYHIVIDPGHGGHDSGAVAEGIDEKNLNLSTALKAAEELQRRGATVTLTRATDKYLSLSKRVSISHAQPANVFISFHYNAFRNPNVGGINTFYYGNEETKLARVVQKSLISHVDLENRGAKTGNFHVIRENNQLALLVELGFMTNPEELDTIKTEKYQEKVAVAIADGLVNYFKK